MKPHYFFGYVVNANFLISALLLLVLVLGAGFYVFNKTAAKRELRVNRTRVHTVVSSEELILALSPRLIDLAKSVRNLRLPDRHSHPLFDARVKLIDLEATAQPRVQDKLAMVGVTTKRWPVAVQSREVSLKQMEMWRPLLDIVDYIEHAKFYVIRGELSDDDPTVFHTDLGFLGLAFTKDDRWLAVKAKQNVSWRRDPTAPADAKSGWRIVAWHLQSMDLTESPRLLFDEVLDLVLPDPYSRRRARKSYHVDYVIGRARTGQVPLANERYRRFFHQAATGQHPALAVADVDDDGWDDLYVMVRWGQNQLLHNQGDGTFVERAAEMDLSIGGVSTSGVFADFDNDGDKDLMLGRSLERSMLLINGGGRFSDQSDARVSVPLPYLVTSVSAADYNGDGLLDVYLSTYGRGGGPKEVEKWGGELLPPDQLREMIRRFGDPEVGYNHFVNRIGPPNVLLAGRGGGRFDVAPESEQLALWLNSFQATWADFDDDGDPDLYVSNDFAPDYLFRNDGEAGFADITKEAGGESMLGFGMGASWGDYDNDGYQDLYISNMYSKAGLRITAQIRNLDPRFRLSADGNRLYRGLSGGRFELVSGRQPPGLQVTQAGWSWGGQFVDLDNDGFLDIYVTSGYDTVPAEIAGDVDL